MADNSSKAYEIYRFVQDMQKEQIKNKTIKPEDVVEISENDFIRDLQDTVNFYTKGTTNTRIIDDVYSNISAIIKNVSSIDEIISGKEIKISTEVIAKSVDMAIQKNEFNVFGVNEELKDTQTLIMMTQFAALKTVEEKKKFFDELPKSDQDSIIRKSLTNIFGENDNDFADAIINYYNIKKEYENECWTKQDKKLSKEINKNTFDAMKLFKRIYKFPEDVDISYSEMAIFIQTIDAIQNGDKSKRESIINVNMNILQKIYGKDISFDFVNNLLGRKLSREEKEFLKKIKTETQKKCELVEEKRGYLKDFVSQILPQKLCDTLLSEDYDKLFMTAIDLNGRLDCISLVTNLQALQQKKSGDNLLWRDQEQFDRTIDNIRSNKDNLREYFEQGFTALNRNESRTLNGSNPQKTNATERTVKSGEEQLSPEMTSEAAFFAFTSTDMLSFAVAPSIGKEENTIDLMGDFANWIPIPDVDMTLVYEASTDEIQVDPTIYGMVDEERPTPPVVEENEMDVRTSIPAEQTSPDLENEDMEVDEDEDRDASEEPETEREENEQQQKIFGKDSFSGLIKVAEVTIKDMRETQNELTPKDQNRINETNALENGKDTK